jgi:NAD+ kinase
VGIICRSEDEDVLMVKRLVECIEEEKEKGVEIGVVFDEKTADKLKSPLKSGAKGEKIENMDVDFLICVGGDGTILKALHSLKTPIPVIGVNMGVIGFLAEVMPEDAVFSLPLILEGFEVEQKERLCVQVEGEKISMPNAMNEVVVVTSRPAKMLHFAISLDGVELERLRADGVVFATPTGSTAYAMSAGGPIVDPRVDACIIVPIAPFKLSARPTVVNASSKLSLQLLEMKEAELVIDGQFYRPIGKEHRISITKGEPAFFVKIRDKLFLRVRDKLRREGM